MPAVKHSTQRIPFQVRKGVNYLDGFNLSSGARTTHFIEFERHTLVYMNGHHNGHLDRRHY